ncbi:MAG: electron transfer flavoprotein subunit alpha/FixB family protein [Capnocytophaga sp.]|jgi:electron transfer flavoprotein subunit alpha|nr:MAG: electron transfer flavoprotein subunit alpha/FixB family protein [Capnocytophaga sp.]RKW15697.1 MAG: electron transfer flavoprotein subunit alpha/FixB family protein [Capnocytophaga sp.]
MILVYTEHNEGQFSKKTLEALSYAKALSDKVVALAVNVADATVLQTYGADKIITVTSDKLTTFSVKTYVELILQVAQKEQVSTVLLPSSANTRYLAPVLAVKWGATYLSNISSLPKDGKVQKVVFSSKAIAWLPLAQKQVITLAGNATEVKQAPVQAEIETFAPTLSEDHITLVGTEKFTSKVSIDDAAIVVSGGRGMQTPDNWHIVEDLADALGAATACTKPVSDMGWRPHSEHIGQTGKPLSCDLYIALGVSGAIQHIAGVNASKVKVVINSDPEAPFFKAADYGIVGDLFEVVPRLTEKIKQLHP